MKQAALVQRLSLEPFQEEDKQNVQLLDLSNQILELTEAVHDYTSAQKGGAA
jgi:hypothetical protein